MLKRKIDHYIKRYYETTRNALLITGARQIGKTYSIRQFGKSFKSFIEINFIDNPFSPGFPPTGSSLSFFILFFTHISIIVFTRLFVKLF